MKPGCSEHQRKIAAYCLGELGAHEKQALETHLASCSQCRSERESYANTIQQLACVGEEDIPHHFFVYTEPRVSSPWKLFRQMPLGWQTTVACTAAMLLFIGIAALSGLQVRADSSGGAITFGKGSINSAAIKKEIRLAVEEKTREERIAFVREMKEEISQSSANLSKQQQAQFTTALAQMDSRLTGRIDSSEGQMRDDTRILVSDMYRVVSQQRARDLEAINIRLDSTDANNAIKTHQTNEILGTLLQVADLKLK